MTILRTRTCEKCNLSVPLEKVKLFQRDKDRNWLVCENCCEKLRKGVQRGETIYSAKRESIRNIYKPKEEVKMFKPKENIKTLPPAETDNKNSIKNDYKTMECKRCKYKFKIQTHKMSTKNKNIVCPYCWKNDQIS